MYKFLSIIILFLLCFGCSEQKEKKENKAEGWNKKKSSEVNKKWAEREEQQIEKYIDRRPDWDITKTGTGLRYYIYSKNPGGDSIQAEMKVHLNYTIELLDGTVCYTSDSTGTESFVVDHADIESGLHEGVKYMREGEEAIIIIPHYLAHGLIGDKSEIPPLSTIVYNIDVIEVSKK